MEKLRPVQYPYSAHWQCGRCENVNAPDAHNCLKCGTSVYGIGGTRELPKSHMAVEPYISGPPRT